MNSDYFHSKLLSLPHFCRDPSYLQSLSHILSISDSWRLARTVSVTIGLEIYSGAWWVHKYPRLRLTVSLNSEPSSSEQKPRTPRTCSSPLTKCWHIHSCASSAQATADALRPRSQWACHALKIAFLSLSPNILLLRFFLFLPAQCFRSFGGGHFWVNYQKLIRIWRIIWMEFLGLEEWQISAYD